MIKKYFLLFFLFLISSTVLATEKISPAKLKIMLDWFPNPTHAPLLVAQQQGFFRDQGLDVEMITPSDPSVPSKLVATEQADIAITYHAQLLLQREAGLPIMRIGVMVDKPLNGVVVDANSSIKSIKDLKGKCVGYSGPVDLIDLSVMLKKEKLKLQDLELVNVHFNLVQAFLSGKVDAIVGVARNFEPIQIKAMGKKIQMFFPEDYQAPLRDELVFVVHQSKILDARFKRFLLALEQGVDYLLKNPQQSWQGFIKLYPQLNNEVNYQSWFESLSYFAKHPAMLNKKRYQTYAQFIKDNQLIKNVPDIKTYATYLNIHSVDKIKERSL